MAEAGSGLARRVLDEFERVTRLLERYPGLGTPMGKGRHAHCLTDFPYSVIYKAEDEDLRIFVVRHQSRDPEYGQARK